MPDEADNDLPLALMTIKLLVGSFNHLAAAFGASDREAAEKAIATADKEAAKVLRGLWGERGTEIASIADIDAVLIPALTSPHEATALQSFAEAAPSPSANVIGIDRIPMDRPQDPRGDGSGLIFTTHEHGGDHPDSMPQAIEVTDKAGRSRVYVTLRE